MDPLVGMALWAMGQPEVAEVEDSVVLQVASLVGLELMAEEKAFR